MEGEVQVTPTNHTTQNILKIITKIIKGKQIKQKQDYKRMKQIKNELFWKKKG